MEHPRLHVLRSFQQTVHRNSPVCLRLHAFEHFRELKGKTVYLADRSVSSLPEHSGHSGRRSRRKGVKMLPSVRSQSFYCLTRMFIGPLLLDTSRKTCL